MFPPEIAIESFSVPATDLPYPALTVCKEQKFDSGEYVRAVFNSFEFACKAGDGSCKASEVLRSHYPLIGKTNTRAPSAAV